MAESTELPPTENPTSTGPLLTGSDFSRLKRVGQGLGLICAAILLEIIGGLLAFIAAIVPDSVQGWIIAGAAALFAVALLAIVVGVGLCLAVPSRARAARFAVAAIALVVAVIVAIRITGHTPQTVRSNPLVNGCLLASAACFLWYLRRLAAFLGQGRLARRAMYILIAMLVVCGSTFMGPFPKRVDGPSLDDYLSGVRTLATIVTVLSYIGLVANLRNAASWYVLHRSPADA